MRRDVAALPAKRPRTAVVQKTNGPTLHQLRRGQHRPLEPGRISRAAPDDLDPIRPQSKTPSTTTSWSSSTCESARARVEQPRALFGVNWPWKQLHVEAIGALLLALLHLARRGSSARAGFRSLCVAVAVSALQAASAAVEEVVGTGAQSPCFPRSRDVGVKGRAFARGRTCRYPLGSSVWQSI